MKKFFEEPEMEVVRFDAKDLIITASGCNDTTSEEMCSNGDEGCGEFEDLE